MAGSALRSNGSASTAAKTPLHNQGRATAEARRHSAAMTSAVTRSRRGLMRTATKGAISAALLRGLCDEALQPAPLVVCQLDGADLQHCRESAFRGSAEEGAQHV